MKRIMLSILFFYMYLAVNAQVDLVMYDAISCKYLPPGTHKFDLVAGNNAPQALIQFEVSWQLDNGSIQTYTNTTNTAQILTQLHPTRIYDNSFQITVTPGTHYLKSWIRSITYPEIDITNDTNVTRIEVINGLPIKNVVLETYKHQSCGPCYPAAMYIKEHVDTMQRYNVVNIYTDPNDDIYLTEGDTVNSVYCPAHPAPLFDRFKFAYATAVVRSFMSFNNQDSLEDLNMREYYYEPVSVAFNNVVFDSTTGLMTVMIKASIFDTLSGDYRFNLFVAEDSILAYQYGAPDPFNYYHMKVLRSMVGGAWGVNGGFPSIMYPGQEFTHQFQYVIDSPLKKEHLHFIGLVQKFSLDTDDRRILNSCKANFNQAIALSLPIAATGQLSIYPNPSKEIIFITAPQIRRNATLTVYDVLGKIISNRPITASTMYIDVRNYLPGIYTLRLLDENHAYNGKFRVE